MTPFLQPTVHLNGTSRQELQRQASEALDGLQGAIEALREMASNGRDFYPQGPGAYPAARKAFDEKIMLLSEIKSLIEDYALGLLEKT